MVVLQYVFNGFHGKHASRVGEKPILSLGAHQTLPKSLAEELRGLTKEAKIELSSRQKGIFMFFYEGHQQ